jgi:tetratricopeptide (TPR) repeat protein
MREQTHLQLALEHHRAGRLDTAKELYGTVLAEEPANVAALRLLGVLQSQRGAFDQAILMLQEAVRFSPDVPEFYNDLGNALRGKGAYQEAVSAYHIALDLHPAYADASFNLGVALESLGQIEKAEEAYTLALLHNPACVEARFNRAAMMMRDGRNAEAREEFLCVQNERPDLPQLPAALGRVCDVLGRWDEAESAYEALVERDPHSSDAHLRLGVVRMAGGRDEGARRAIDQALLLNPDFAEAHYHSGVLELRSWHFARAVVELETARRLRPDRPEAHVMLGVAAQQQGQLDVAQACFENGLTCDPENADAHYRYADLLLMRGDYLRGWEEYEWRWRHRWFLSPRRKFSQPLWNGEDLCGRTILLHPEQGLGDTLQFVRYARLVASRGGRVLLGSPPELVRLLASVPGMTAVVTSPEKLPSFEVHAPLLSLPRIFGTTVETIPAAVPYVFAPAELVEAWAERLGETTNRLRVGIVWSGNPKQEHNRHRASCLRDFAPLGDVPGVKLYSLQKGSPAAELNEPPPGMNIVDFGPDLTDFTETAALVTNLDLVVTVDTAVAHLAGALAKPVWVLLSSAPDWRWMLGREDTPWYPTMRLFRQTRPGAWESVMQSVIRALQQEHPRRRTEPLAFSPGQTLLNALDLHRKGLMKDAERGYRAVLAGESTNADALCLLSVVLFQQGEIDEALRFGEESLRTRPDSPDASNAVGNCLRSRGDLPGAERMFRRAIALQDEYADAHYNLGACLCDAWRLEEAEEAFRVALRLDRSRPQTWNNLGLVKYRAGRMGEALDDYRRCLSIAPEFVDAHFNLAHLLLQLGNFQEGWREYEWRWKKSGFLAMLSRHPGPQWNGEELLGRSLLVWAEQGFGDTLQFLRFIPPLRSRGAIVHVECPSALRRLVERVDGVASVTGNNQPLPAFDVHVPLMSLPGLLETKTDTIPAVVPYLLPDADSCQQWKKRLAPAGTAFRVGVVWSGSSTNPAGSYRSIPIDLLDPLAEIQHVQFVNLQTGKSAREFSQSAIGSQGSDWAVSPADFMDTAGVIEQLDLVITIDTAVLHLAGGMGKPVWALLARPWIWPWGMDGERTPWYPTMRLYRQEVHGEWQTIMSQLKRDLEAVVAFRVGDNALPPAQDTFVSIHDLGVALLEAGRPDEAIPLLDQAVSARPELPIAHFSLALALLVTGEWKRGFEEYEWRLRTDCGQPSLRPYEQPRLTGLPPKGSTVYLYAEQGFGDAIQFIRYAHLLAEHQIHVIVECRQELFRFMQMVQGVGEVIVRGEQAPRFDFHAPLLSLPLIFQSTPTDVPANVPYVHVGHDLRRKWAKNLAELPRGRKIGLAWSGNPKNSVDPRRSVPAEELMEVLTGTNGVLVNLQKDGDPAPVGMADWTGSIQDFADTAALIEQLDLVISVDTAVAHLAGALGKPVWTLVQYAPDWRWMLRRTDTPWYPTMRLFRQIHPTSWHTTLGALRIAVQEWFGPDET